MSAIESPATNALDAEELLTAASRITGLRDFGPEDFSDGLGAFVEAANAERKWIAQDYQYTRQRVIRLLVNRLYFAEDLAMHPEISGLPMRPPAVISSLPRSGTTKLHRLLAATGMFQTMKMWQGHLFARIPGRDDGGRIERIQETTAYVQHLRDSSPNLMAVHSLAAEEPEEDFLLSEFSFRHPSFAQGFEADGYARWLESADMQPTYDYLALQLRYLQWQDRARQSGMWLLKSPYHLGSETHLSRAFGEVGLIVTHRDPVACAASGVNLQLQGAKIQAAAQGTDVTLNSQWWWPAIRKIIAQWAARATRQIQWRDRHPHLPVLDLSYAEINEDGIGVARRVYDFLGLDFSGAAERAAIAWQRENPKDKYGKNEHFLAGAGMAVSEIEDLFSDYIKRYSEFL